MLKSKPFIISLLIHLLLAGGALLYKISMEKQNIQLLELVDFKIAGFEETGITPGKPTAKTPLKPVVKKMAAPTKIDLPKANIDDDLKIDSENAVNNTEPELKTSSSLTSNIGNLGKLSKQNLNLEQSNLPVGLDYLKSLENKISKGTNPNSPYILEGEAAFRTVLAKTLPKYPKNIQKNAKIKLNFDLLPNGEVKNIIVTKKVDTALEQASINALKIWKFNPIAASKVQKGQITFIFELK